MSDQLKQTARRWAARQAERQAAEEARLRRVAVTSPPVHPWKVTEAALEWEANLPANHPWHRDSVGIPPAGVVRMGDLFVVTD
jgi:hypothetical protein